MSGYRYAYASITNVFQGDSFPGRFPAFGYLYYGELGQSPNLRKLAQLC